MQSWEGVVQLNDRVTALDLHDQMLVSIPDTIGALDALVKLNFKDNSIPNLPDRIENLSNLSVMYAAGNTFSEIPVAIGNLTALEVLDLSRNAIDKLPLEMGNLVNLDTLFLNDNELTGIPAEIGDLTNLKQLHIQNNLLTFIPQEVCDLDLGGTVIEKDKGVGCDAAAGNYQILVALLDANPGNTLGWDLNDRTMQSWNGVVVNGDGTVAELKLANSGLTEIPREIGGLTNLTLLDLQNNFLDVIPQEVCELELSGTTVKKDANVVCTEAAANYEILVILLNANSGNTLGWDVNDKTMKSWFGVVLHGDGTVVELNIGDTSLDTIPSEIANLSNLQYLNIENNFIDVLPREVCALETRGTVIEKDPNVTCEVDPGLLVSNYEALVALYNANADAQVELGWDLNDTTMQSWSRVTLHGDGTVKNLSFSRLDLTTIPPEMGSLTNSVSLDFNFNLISSLPREMGNLTSLQELYLFRNELTSVPPELGNLFNLTTLVLGDNDLTTVPAELGNLTNLTQLDLQGNPLASLPPEVCALTAQMNIKKEDFCP